MKLRPHTNRRYLDALADHVVVFDGAMGTSIQACNLGPMDFGGEALNGCNDYLVISQPEVVEQIHASFLAVGCEAIETDTFRANRITMREYALQDRIVEMNRAAAALARRVADRFEHDTGIPRFVAGSIGPSGMLPSANDPTLSNVTFAELVDVFREQSAGLIRGGADLLLIETQQDILETKAAVHGAWRAFEETGLRIPLQVHITLDTTGRMLLGTDIAAALTTLECLPVIDVIGLNCSTGPDYMREPVRYLCAHSRKPISVVPNAGLPLNVDGNAVYPMQPVPLAETLAEFVTELGVNAVGGCCGTTPEHLKELIDRVRGLKPKNRFTAESAEGAEEPNNLSVLSASSAVKYIPMISSAMRAIPLHQDPPPMIVGERVNSQGSRKVKRLLLADDYEGILEVAREQVEGGAHTLDVCVALTERPDEAEQMRQVVKKLQMSVETPLMIDSTEADVLRLALETNPGRAIINSINLERGRERCDAVLPLAVAHGAAVIALTIDERGMAKTAEAKLEVARRIYEIAVNEYGLAPDALIFDALTFTLATGDAEMAGSAIETIEGIRKIKAGLPGVLASLGVSNVSFGLSAAARAALNSAFLYHCVQAGLDLALVHPKDITPYAEIDSEVRALCDDLIFNRAPDALTKFIQHFDVVATAVANKPAEDPTEGMAPEQKIHWMILHRKKDGLEPLIDASIEAHGPAQGRTLNEGAIWTLNNVLLPAMKEVGDKFGAGELILPFVLQSAEVMKKAVAHLEQYLDRKEGATKGKVVLATVYGDVHDIGKSLVNTILTNNGYTVFDLGKQVPANVIIDKAIETNATAIGLSALLVSTSKQMPLIVNELHKRGLSFPVLIGGAAINRKFGRRILFTESGEPYSPGVFYCKDAFEGLDSMEKLIDPAERGDFVGRIIEEARLEVGRSTLEVGGVPANLQPPTSNVQRLQATGIPMPPFWGARVIREMPLEIVLQHLDLDELYRLQWGAKNTHGEEWVRLKAEFETRLERMRREALKLKYLEPRAVYGYFPAQSQGESLVIYDPSNYPTNQATSQPSNGKKALRELARFTFPRQPERDRLCLADYFAPADSGIMDVVALQVVTVGPRAEERFLELQARGDYTEAYFTHGLSAEAAEATAEYVHRHVRRELGLDAKRGKRYSWGYPACPDLDDHAQVFQLLPAEKELGMQLTSAFQLVPEHSTAAIIVHHPGARYYSVGVSRVEQLMAG
ncbi:MAG TPA: methionine synthase [Anaerolineae bacterium]|nr:methionine synthase [Anaerolineae bacterium]